MLRHKRQLWVALGEEQVCLVKALAKANLVVEVDLVEWPLVVEVDLVE